METIRTQAPTNPPALDEHPLTAQDEARAESMVFETLVALLINEPSQGLLQAAQQLARTLDEPIVSDVSDIDSLKQRFYDRFLIPTSPLFVPCNEQCIRNSSIVDGRTAFPSVGGALSRHVVECYKAVGFDYRELRGCAPAISRLLPDSLASELAFVASMRLRESTASTSELAQSCREYADKFLAQHLTKWVDAYASFAEAKAADFYSEWARLAARIVTASAAE